LGHDDALIGFGFTIVQFFARIQQTSGITPGYFPDAPRFLGLSLIFCGVMALVISIWEYHWGLRYLSFAVIAGAPRGKANAASRGGDRPCPHRNIRFLCRAVASLIGTQWEEHQLNGQFNSQIDPRSVAWQSLTNQISSSFGATTSAIGTSATTAKG
jgi:hypothetical protein